MRWRQATSWAKRSCSFTGSRKVGALGWHNSRILSYANGSVSSRWICVATASRKALSVPSTRRGNPLAALAGAQYNDGNVETTSRSWAYDLDATIEALHLDHPVLIGWSAGAWAVQSYFFAHSGLGAIGKAVLYASVPVLLPPGTEDGGSHLSVRPETIDGLLRTYPINPTVEPALPNDDRTVTKGLMDLLICASPTRRTER
jgi:pimeloyl-ACP methyl ester carboxylesterase